MKFNLEEHLSEGFSNQSKVWVYQSSKILLINELLEIEEVLKDFVANWLSHGDAVKGSVNVFFGRFVVFMADDTQSKIGGCSTDSSVRLIKELEKKYNTDFFNRQLLSFYKNDKVEQIPLNQFAYAFNNGLINEETLFFDNTVSTKKDLVERWMTPVKNSWLHKKLLTT